MTNGSDGARASPLRPIVILAAALAAIILLVPLAQHLFGGLLHRPSVAALGAPTLEALFTLALAAALLAVATAGLRFEGGFGGLGGRAPLAMAPLGAGIGIAGLLAAAGLAALAALMRPGTHGGSGAALLVGTLAVLVQSAAEEVYFRGWLQPALARAWGALPGLLVAAAAFAALHVVGGARSPLSLANLFLGGVLFGLLALRTGGLAAPVAAHFAWNWGEQILLGLDPNPGAGSFGAVMDLDMVGSRWWGGSDEGLNASLGDFFVLVALIIPLAAWRPAVRA